MISFKKKLKKRQRNIFISFWKKENYFKINFYYEKEKKKICKFNKEKNENDYLFKDTKEMEKMKYHLQISKDKTLKSLQLFKFTH